MPIRDGNPRTRFLCALALVVVLCMAAACSPDGSLILPTAVPASLPQPATEELVRVGILQLVSHPALDAGREGAIQALADAGFVEGESIEYELQNAHGDIASLRLMAEHLRDQQIDLIITVSTPSLQTALGVFQESTTPIVFNTVVDPYQAANDVIKSPTDKPAHVTGVQSLPPVKEAMMLAQQIVPGATRFGMLWSPSEANSEAATKIARKAAQELGIDLIESTVSSTSDVQLAAESLVAKDIDLFFVSTDSTVVTALESLVKVANESQIPLIANDPGSAARGAVAALGVDYYQAGYESGQMAAQILGGQNPQEFSIQQSSSSFLAINTEAAELQNVSFPEEVRQQAQETHEQIGISE